MRRAAGLRRSSKREEEAAPSHDRWLLSYADFVTLLLAVFIVLFAFSRGRSKSVQTVSAGIHAGFEKLSAHDDPKPDTGPTDAANPLPPAPVMPAPLPVDTTQLKTQLEGVLGDAIDKHEIVVQQTTEGLIISLRDFGFFKSGDATLLPGAAEQLRKTAHVLMDHHLELRVEGHSDNQPIHTPLFQSNWQLSSARATSVLTLLVDDAGFPPDKISVAGYGPYRPVADNATAEGRGQNRRVDLVIVEPKVKVVPHP
jgi:chemotaxis protein MotB